MLGNASHANDCIDGVSLHEGRDYLNSFPGFEDVQGIYCLTLSADIIKKLCQEVKKILLAR